MKIDYIHDTDWISALKEGNLQAFGTLFDRYGKRLYHFSLGYLKSAENAEEIVQEVFLKIWDSREKLSTEKSLEAYLFTIARNGILNSIRKSKSELAYQNYVKINQEKHVLLDEELNFNELERAYKAAVEKLSPRKKEVFLLSKVHALTNAEIAEKLNISIKTVENQMTAAIFEVRRELRSLGFSGIIFVGLFFR